MMQAASSTWTTPIVALPPSSSGSCSPGRGEPAEPVDDGLVLGSLVLDDARPVDDPEPEDREVESVLPCIHLETKLAPDLREVRQVALRAVRVVRR